MIKVIFNGNQIEIENNTTLQEFVGANASFGAAYRVNGVAVAPETILQNYNVIEFDATGTVINEVLNVSMVDIDLVDFTGRSGHQRIANNIDAVRENYNQDVRISVIRDGHTVSTNTLLTGDRVMVSPEGGIKGA